MKQQIKVYLEPKDLAKLISKAKALGLNGRGCLSHYLSRIANKPIVFLNEDIIKLMKQ